MKNEIIDTPELRSMSRAEARRLGLKRYYTGRPCPQGHLSERTVSGYSCIECKRVFVKNNRDRIKKYPRAEMSAERLSALREREADARLLNKDRVKQQKLAHEIKFKHTERWKERARAYSQKYYYRDIDASRQSGRAQAHRRRVREIASEEHYKAADILRIGALQHWRCINCKKSIKTTYHVDHIYPLSRGGSNAASNIQLLCQPCNQRKHAKDPISWAQEQGRLL